MTAHPLLDAGPVGPLRPYLDTVGEVFRVFDRQDSGCVSYGVQVSTERWFVKTATTDAAVAALARARAVHAAIRHPAIIGLRHEFTAAGSPVLVYPWFDGDLLYHPTADPSRPRRDPASPWSRFRRLPLGEVQAAVGTILDAHVAVAAAGFVASDLYDGCFLYDFGRRQMRLLDLDEYRPGPFVATDPCGSRRFMAPEEVPGGRADHRTTVFLLGRSVRLLLDAGDDESAWRGSGAQLAVAERATRAAPAERFQTVPDLVAAWRAASA